MKRIFEDAAPGIVKGTGVAVSRGLQEAFIKVDEEGATAGAFTGNYLLQPTFLILYYSQIRQR